MSLRYHFTSLSLSINVVATQPNPPERHFGMHAILFLHFVSTHLSILDDLGVQTLGVLDVDGLDVGVELLLGALLVVTLTRDANAQAVWDALDAGLPDLLVQLGVKTDIFGALQ